MGGLGDPELIAKLAQLRRYLHARAMIEGVAFSLDLAWFMGYFSHRQTRKFFGVVVDNEDTMLRDEQEPTKGHFATYKRDSANVVLG